MNKKKITYGIIALAVLALLLFFFMGGKKRPQASYNEAVVTKGEVSTTITATGTIEPVTQVEVGTQVSGIIDKIYVDFNSEVKKGQVIAEMDRRNLTSDLTTAQSNLASAKSSLDYQEAYYKRYKTLYDKGLISTNDYENAYLQYQQAKETYRSRQESVRTAQQNLAYATITSPIDGVILDKAVEEGQTVAAGFSTPTLFTIAQDLTDMRVIADIDEADIGGVKEGQRVQFSVDAYPDETFEGSVTQVRQQATTESNVVTYEVVIGAPNKDLKLKPGLTANVTIYTNQKNDVLLVPNKALKFTPNPMFLGPDGKIQDTQAAKKVWTKQGNTFTAHKVETGITNGSVTEIISGVKEGTKVVTELNLTGVPTEVEGGSNNPFMPGPPGRRNNSSSNNSSNNSSRN
ncbi:MAG: efflux RND transporter periplasmic adaptor subunit [Bacteroidaceae bacterium]|nr:efflux RND transporter periplasmic adaptor subunit [Bacteroidaceae bacterium]